MRSRLLYTASRISWTVIDDATSLGRRGRPCRRRRGTATQLLVDEEVILVADQRCRPTSVAAANVNSIRYQRNVRRANGQRGVGACAQRARPTSRVNVNVASAASALTSPSTPGASSASTKRLQAFLIRAARVDPTADDDARARAHAGSPRRRDPRERVGRALGLAGRERAAIDQLQLRDHATVSIVRSSGTRP